MLIWKKDTDFAIPKKNLEQVRDILMAIDETNFDLESIKSALTPFAEIAGKGSVLWPTRVALSGREKSPDPFTLISILGKKECVARLSKAIEILN